MTRSERERKEKRLSELDSVKNRSDAEEQERTIIFFDLLSHRVHLNRVRKAKMVARSRGVQRTNYTPPKKKKVKRKFKGKK